MRTGPQTDSQLQKASAQVAQRFHQLGIVRGTGGSLFAAGGSLRRSGGRSIAVKDDHIRNHTAGSGNVCSVRGQKAGNLNFRVVVLLSIKILVYLLQSILE